MVPGCKGCDGKPYLHWNRQASRSYHERSFTFDQPAHEPPRYGESALLDDGASIAGRRRERRSSLFIDINPVVNPSAVAAPSTGSARRCPLGGTPSSWALTSVPRPRASNRPGLASRAWPLRPGRCLVPASRLLPSTLRTSLSRTRRATPCPCTSRHVRRQRDEPEPDRHHGACPRRRWLPVGRREHVLERSATRHGDGPHDRPGRWRQRLRVEAQRQ
jgi:hypothetical protein